MIYLFHGENTYAAKRQVHKLMGRYKDSTGSDFGLHRFSEADEPEAVIQAITAVPMFSSSSLVIIENPSQSKPLMDALSPKLEHVPDETVVVIHDPDIDKRTSWFKTLQKQATVKEFTAKSRAQLLKWIPKAAQIHGSTINKEAGELLLEYTGEDERRLEQEIAKLADSGDPIDAERVRTLVRPNPRQTIFTLLDALSGGDIESALQYLDDLRSQNIHELEILAMLGWQVRVFLVVASADSVSDQQLASDFGMKPYTIQKAKPIAKRVPVDTLQNAYQQIIATDYAIKTSQHEPRVLLEQLLAQLHDYLRQ
ncbi:DNA polymerase III subunit delta [Candidatus Saccharibacteria bacterium QS_5_54_17]|nr:MAG: DNA polymerase III subunit delta [Candidatus Saccharibacteria bacterium QS_5_54_17]